jgi:hypothetical protein
MRRFIPALLLLGGCAEEQPPPQKEAAAAAISPGLYRSGEGDALCVKPDGRAGFIVFAAGKAGPNCSVRGQLRGGSIVPDGDSSCRIAVTPRGGSVALGGQEPACAYYCGPKASFAGKEFARQGGSGEAVDLAGDPLC